MPQKNAACQHHAHYCGETWCVVERSRLLSSYATRVSTGIFEQLLIQGITMISLTGLLAHVKLYASSSDCAKISFHFQVQMVQIELEQSGAYVVELEEVIRQLCPSTI